MFQAARRYLPAMILFFITACATTAPPEHQRGWSDARRDLEHDFLHFLAFTELPEDTWQTNDAEGFERALATKVVAQSELEASIRAYIALHDADDEALAWALLRTGQSYLNVACEIQRLIPPGELDPQEQTQVKAHLLELTSPIADQGRTWFAKTAQTGQRPWSDSAEDLLIRLDRFAEHPDTTCQTTAPYWHPEQVQSD